MPLKKSKFSEKDISDTVNTTYKPENAKSVASASNSIVSSNSFNSNPIDNTQMIRLVCQYLQDSGFKSISDQLIKESNVPFYKDPNTEKFVDLIKKNKYLDSIKLLPFLTFIEEKQRHLMHFLVLRQVFLDYLLIEEDNESALKLLKESIFKLNIDASESKLHLLTSLIINPQDKQILKTLNYLPTDLNFSYEFSANSLLEGLSNLTKSSEFIPPKRLLSLMNQALVYQSLKDPYYLPHIDSNTSSELKHGNTVPRERYSLLHDIYTDESQFPKRVIKTLSQHQEECWFVKYSNTGKYLVTTSRDGNIVIYDTTDDYSVLHILKSHSKAVLYCSFSNDDTKLISSSMDLTVKVWNIVTGEEISSLKLDGTGSTRYWAVEFFPSLTFAGEEQSCELFVAGSPDKRLDIYDIHGKQIYVFETDYRVDDLKVTPDGKKLIIITHSYDLVVFDLTKKSLRCISKVHIGNKLTSLSISPNDPDHCLINVSSECLQLWNIKDKAYLVQKYYGQRQNPYVIRSCLTEDLVICGSEDGNCYIWNRRFGNLIDIVGGHNGLVNSVDWNPASNCEWASGGDDSRVKIWSL